MSSYPFYLSMPPAFGEAIDRAHYIEFCDNGYTCYVWHGGDRLFKYDVATGTVEDTFLPGEFFIGHGCKLERLTVIEFIEMKIKEKEKDVQSG